MISQSTKTDNKNCINYIIKYNKILLEQTIPNFSIHRILFIDFVLRSVLID